MAQPRTITANTCFGCNQTFMTGEMLRSHVCPQVDMKDPKKKRAYIEATEQMHKQWERTFMRAKETKAWIPEWKRIRDALEKMPSAEREIFIWGKGVLASTDEKHMATQLAEMGYKADDKGKIYYAGPVAAGEPWTAGWQHSWVPQWPSGESFYTRWSAKPSSMSGGVSFQWADGPERTSDVEMVTQEEKVLEEYIHEICEEEEVTVARLNELLRIRRSEGWQNRALMRFLLDEEVSEQDLFPEKFEGEAEE